MIENEARAREMVFREYGMKPLDYKQQKKLLQKNDKSWPLFRDAIKAEFLHCVVGDFADEVMKTWPIFASFADMFVKTTKIGVDRCQDINKNQDLFQYHLALSDKLIRMAKNFPGNLESITYYNQYFFTKHEMEMINKGIESTFESYQLQARANLVFNSQQTNDTSLSFANSASLDVDYPRGRSISPSIRRITSNLKISSFYDRSLLEKDSMPTEEIFSRWFAFDRLLDNQLHEYVRANEQRIRTEIIEKEFKERKANLDKMKVDLNETSKLILSQDEYNTEYIRELKEEYEPKKINEYNNAELFFQQDINTTLREKPSQMKTKVAQILNTEDAKLSPELKDLKQKVSELAKDDLERKLKATFTHWPQNDAEITIENVKNNMPDKNHILYIIHADEKDLTDREKEFRGIFLGDPDYFHSKYPDSVPEIKDLTDLGKYANIFHGYNMAEGLTKDFKSASEPNIITTENFIFTNDELKLIEEFDLPTPSKDEIKNMVDKTYSNCVSELQLVAQEQKASNKKRAQIPKILGAVALTVLGGAGAFAVLTFAAVALGPVLALAAAVASAVAGLAFGIVLVVSGIKKIVEANRQLSEAKLQIEQLKNKNEPVKDAVEQEQTPKDLENGDKNKAEKDNTGETKVLGDNGSQRTPENDSESHKPPTENQNKKSRDGNSD